MGVDVGGDGVNKEDKTNNDPGTEEREEISGEDKSQEVRRGVGLCEMPGKSVEGVLRNGKKANNGNENNDKN